MYILGLSPRPNLRAFLELQNRCSLRWWSSLEYSDQIRSRCRQSPTSVTCRITRDLWRHCRTVSKTDTHNGQHLPRDFREHQQCKKQSLFGAETLHVQSGAQVPWRYEKQDLPAIVQP